MSAYIEVKKVEQLRQLQTLLKTYQKVAIAYSGGCDSHFLYHVAMKTLGKENVLAIFCQGDMMSKEDIEDAKAFLKDGQYVIVNIDVLSCDAFVHNRKDRCYHCKKMMMTHVITQAHQHGFQYVLDGQNLDDQGVYRPGIKACQELGIISPMVEVRLTKAQIREYARYYHLPTSDKPANACLASRFPYDTLLTKAKLQQVDMAEACFHRNGIHHIRVRVHQDLARIEVEKKDFQKVIENHLYVDELEKLGFRFVTLDLKGITSGSYDKVK